MQIEVDGVQGLLSSYESCLQTVTLYGPTNFAPVIKHITMQVRSLALAAAALMGGGHEDLRRRRRRVV